MEQNSQPSATAPRRVLPHAIQSFKEMREGGYVYVDKTDLIWKLAQASKVQFITRPRRFGKSLMISTLKSYFQGDAALFKGLKMEALETRWTKHPTFVFGFSSSSFNRKDDVYDLLSYSLRDYEALYGITPEGGVDSRFKALLREAYAQTGIKPVILVDEYDNPLTDTIAPDQQALHQHYKRELRGFYKTIKECTEILHRVVITGITQFSELSLFSSINQLVNVTLDDQYATLCGITEQELVDSFAPEIARFAQAQNTDFDGALAILRRQYDGYQFTPRGPHVYNPQSLIQCFHHNVLYNFWSQSGTPAMLSVLIPNYTFDMQRLLEPTVMSQRDMHIIDFSGTNPIPLLYQTGYLTIREYYPEEISYLVEFPNSEVRQSFWQVLLPIFHSPKSNGTEGLSSSFTQKLNAFRHPEAMGELMALIAGVPYSALCLRKIQASDDTHPEKQREEARTRIYEELFQTALYAWFTALRCDVRTEVHSLGGRADAVLTLRNGYYLFELKVGRGGETAQRALEQIKEKGYAEPLRAAGKPIHAYGVVFDSRPERRGECEWLHEQLQ